MCVCLAPLQVMPGRRETGETGERMVWESKEAKAHQVHRVRILVRIRAERCSEKTGGLQNVIVN